MSSALLVFVLLLFYCTKKSVGDFHSICTASCSVQVLKRKVDRYQECMSTCLHSYGLKWALADDTSACQAAGDSAGSLPACSAEHLQVKSYTHNVSDISAGFRCVKEFISVTWTPCPYGISDVIGYEVQLFETQFSGYSYCKNVLLKEHLGVENIGDHFSVLFSGQGLDYSTTYQVWVEGLPKSDHRYYAYLKYDSMSCYQVNGDGSCTCGLQGFKSLPTLNISVTGYTVVVSLQPLEACFNVHKYRLSILMSENTTQTIETADMVSANNMGSWTYQFGPLYGARPSSTLLVQYHAFSDNGEYRGSDPLLINISDWKPTVTSVSVDNKTGQVVVVWPCAETYYNITKIDVKVNLHSIYTGDSTYHISHTTMTDCGTNVLWASYKFYLARSGTYSVRIRESRDYSQYFPGAEWSRISSNTTFVYGLSAADGNHKFFIMCVGLFFPLTLVLMATCTVFYCGRRGYCKKVRHQLPLSFEYLLGLPGAFQHRNKCVWIVWEADTRSAMMSELHSENIRHLASYLANHCSLDVILDQYDRFLTGSLTAWIQSSFEKAEVIIFVCPHLPRKLEDSVHVPVLGNFMAVFRFCEKEILAGHNLHRFITVTLPYSDKNASAAAQLLVKTTHVFSFMKDIEDLYFCIQGYPKMNRFGRHLVRNVNREEFEDTREGEALAEGVKRLIYLQKAGIKEDDRSCSRFAKYDKDPTTVCQETFKTSTNFKPCPPPPVIDNEDAEESMFLINTNGLLSLGYPEVQAQAVIFDQSFPCVSAATYIHDDLLRKNIVPTGAHSGDGSRSANLGSSGACSNNI